MEGKYPKTIGEELKAQIKYAKVNGVIINNSALTLAMRKIEKEVFGVSRQYKAKDEEISNHIYTSRPALITELTQIEDYKEISNYFLLFSAFKSLCIIREDYNIIKMLDYHFIEPKKKGDKERLKEFREKFDAEMLLYNFPISTKCFTNANLECVNYTQCISIKLKEKLKNLTESEQLQLFYKLGFPSNITKLDPKTYGRYYISLETLKGLLSEFQITELLEYINDKEKIFYEETSNFYNKKQNIVNSLFEVEAGIKQEILEKETNIKGNEKDRKNREDLRKAKNSYDELKNFIKKIYEKNTKEISLEKSEKYKKFISDIKEKINTFNIKI